MKCSLGICNFLERIANLSYSIASLSFFAPFSEVGFLISPCVLWNSAFTWVYPPLSPSPFASPLSVRPPQKTILPSCISFSLGSFWSLTLVQCYKPLSIVLQALLLPDLIPRIHLSPPLYSSKGIGLGHT